jgi:hypothetical protein
MRGFSRFRLWRIDSARDKLKARVYQVNLPHLAGGQIAADVLNIPATDPQAGAATRGMLEQLTELRLRCQRHTGSIATPMADEMFYPDFVVRAAWWRNSPWSDHGPRGSHSGFRRSRTCWSALATSLGLWRQLLLR